MTNYKYLKENNLFEAHMKFMRAIGESFGYQPIEEAEEDPDNNQGGPDAGANPPQGDIGGGMPDDPNQMGGPDAGANPPQGDIGGDMPGDPNQMGGEQPMGGPDMNGGTPDMMGGPNMEVPNMEDEGEEDNVIDVDDITKAQEKTNDKVNSVGKDLGKVDTRIEKLLGAIDKLQVLFDKNNEEIADLRKEFEKRNPTQTEKLNLRSLDSYPFKVKPTDYWDNKSMSGNYSAYADNQEPTTREYVITNDDVDDFSEREIADSFSIADELNQNIKKIFGL